MSRSRRPRPERGYTPTRGTLKGRTFPSERAYRRELARRRGFASVEAQRRTARVVRTRAAEAKLPPAQQEARHRALEALALMRREGRSLSAAAKHAGTTRAAVLRYAGSALTKDGGGKYTAAKSDRLFRRMRFLSPEGLVEIGVTDSRAATRIARYMAAVDRYLRTGDTAGLRAFRGKAVRVAKVAYPFLTDPRTLDRLGHAGEVSFEDLYAAAA